MKREPAPEFKPPLLTTRAQRAAEDFAERVDYWKAAHALIAPGSWHEGYQPYDVLALARFLAGKPTDD